MDYFIFWRMYELFHRFYRYKFVGEIHLDKSRLSKIDDYRVFQSRDPVLWKQSLWKSV